MENKKKLEKINLSFKSKEFKLYDNGEKIIIKIEEVVNTSNSLKVKINNKEFTTTIKYGNDKVYLGLKEIDKIIDITKNTDLIDFMWQIFNYNGCNILYKYTSEYKNNYCD